MVVTAVYAVGLVVRPPENSGIGPDSPVPAYVAASPTALIS
jgi:hypothetical protein